MRMTLTWIMRFNFGIAICYTQVRNMLIFGLNLLSIAIIFRVHRTLDRFKTLVNLTRKHDIAREDCKNG